MATLFAPRFYAQPQPNLRGLFRLLDEFEQHSAQQEQCRRAARRVPVFAPRFDVKETESTFELHGELPGINKDNVSIEFTDPQTIVIRGQVERSQSAGTPHAAASPEATKPDEEVSGALPNAEEDEAVLVEHDHASETSSVKSLKATVEDDPEEPAAQATPATTVAETAKPAPAPAPPAPKEDTTPKARYWVSERSVGQFARSFHFPSRVEHEAVTASMANGILSVSVPKAKKHESRRIAIN